MSHFATIAATIYMTTPPGRPQTISLTEELRDGAVGLHLHGDHGHLAAHLPPEVALALAEMLRACALRHPPKGT